MNRYGLWIPHFMKYAAAEKCKCNIATHTLSVMKILQHSNNQVLVCKNSPRLTLNLGEFLQTST
jgi:hypothetical protein